MTSMLIYKLSEHVAMDKDTVFFKGRVIFKQYIPKNKCFGIQIHKLCYMTGYVYNMGIYLGKDMQNAT